MIIDNSITITMTTITIISTIVSTIIIIIIPRQGQEGCRRGRAPPADRAHDRGDS